jgi:integrase/recombinase XerD
MTDLAGPSSAASVDAYLTHLSVERRLSMNSVESYARDLQLLGRYAAGIERPLPALTAPDLDGFVRALMSEGRSPNSVARAVACVRGFYRFLALDGRVPVNPADGLRPPKAWKALPSFLSGEDVDRLLAAPDVHTPKGLRDRALIELLYATGMRVSELLSLRPISPVPERGASSASCRSAIRRPAGSAGMRVRLGRTCSGAGRARGCSSTRAVAPRSAGSGSGDY